MRQILTYLTTLLLFSLGFTSCIEEQTQTTILTTSFERGGLGDDLLNTSNVFADEAYKVLQEQLNIPQEIRPFQTEFPQHIQREAGFQPEARPNLEKLALLGRVLFYDNRLSATEEVSCASCHDPALGFSDPVAFSKGIRGQQTLRNSIGLGTVASFEKTLSGYGNSQSRELGTVNFFWDGRATTITAQSLETIANPIEMGKNINELSEELSEIPMYRILNHKAFNTSEIHPGMVLLALEAFVSSITTIDTKFDDLMDARLDRVSHQELLASGFTASELLGERLFNDNCASCHGEKLLKLEVTIANNGLDLSYADKGHGELSRIAAFDGVFKVPFLRNVAVTGPYMHDGRFNTLREVIDHYSEGIQDHPNLHENLRKEDGSVRRMQFTETEKAALEDFLLMTTDRSQPTAVHLSDPFIR